MAARHGKLIQLMLLRAGRFLLPDLAPRAFQPLEEFAIAPCGEHSPRAFPQ